MMLLTIPLLFLLCGEGQGRSLIPHVTAPEKWRLGVLEKVLVQTSQQSESFPVTVSLVSYPEKKTTFSSALLALTPENRFRGALKLSVEAEDSPGEFVYLVVESEVFREDRRIPVTSAARTTMDEPDISALRRKRRQSLLTAPQLQGMTNRYQNPKIQQCCLDGSTQYSQHENCKSQHSEELKRRKPHCYRAYEECCIYTEEHMVKYLVMGPRMWRVGAQETVLIQAFGYKENLLITISLLSYPDKQKRFSTESLELNSDNNYQGRVTLRIRPNDFPRKDGATQFVCLQAKTSSFTKEERVPVSHHNGFLFIQSDKPVYTPDQSVKVRIYSMDEELRPARRAVTVTFKDPDEVKMDVITQQDATGIISFPDFKIPANPKFGTWKIEARYSADYTTSTMAAFDVKEYVLPRFFVTIVPSQNFISYDTFDEFTITVKANYYYGKKLEQAKVFIRYGIIQGGERRMMTKSIDVLTMIGGEAVFQFNSRRAVDELGFSQLEELDGSYLYITISVEETAGSQSEESENADVRYVITPYTLKLIGTPLYVKPTLPYYVKVQVKDTLDKAVPRIRLSLTGEMVQDDGEVSPLSSYHSQIQMTDGKGIAEFVVNIPADVTILEFTIKTADKNLQDENQARSTYTATAYKSPTKSYLYINWARESEVMHVGGYLNVQVVPKSPYMAKLTHYSYLVISKGKIITYNTVQRVHDSTSQNLNIQITSAMVPSIRLLVYYIITGDSTAEVVADSIWVDVREKCINNQEVQLSTKKRVFQPKASVPLTVQAQTGSIVALSAVDVSVYDVTKKTQRPMDRVLRRIEESDLGCGAGAGKDNKEVFELAGLTFITNANIRASQTTGGECWGL